jgi:hypothetical protein
MRSSTELTSDRVMRISDSSLRIPRSTSSSRAVALATRSASPPSFSSASRAFRLRRVERAASERNSSVVTENGWVTRRMRAAWRRSSREKSANSSLSVSIRTLEKRVSRMASTIWP